MSLVLVGSHPDAKATITRSATNDNENEDMTTTADRLAEQMTRAARLRDLERRGIVPEPEAAQSLTDRLLASAAWRAAADQARAGVTPRLPDAPITVGTAEDLARHVRQRAGLSLSRVAMSENANETSLVQPHPKGGRLSALATILPVDDQATVIDETARSGQVAETAYGLALPAANITLTESKASNDAPRVGVYLEAPADIWRQESVAREAVGRLVDQEWVAHLDRALITGIDTHASVTTTLVDTAIEARHVAIAKAAIRIREDDHPGALTLIARPSVIQSMVLQDTYPDFRDTLRGDLGVSVFVPSPFAPAGTAFLASMPEAVAYLRSGLMVSVAESDQSDFLAGMVKIAAVTRVRVRLARPSGFEKLTGM